MGSFQSPRGTRDILSPEVSYWQWVEATARTQFAQAAYREVRTPIFEETALFARGIGEATDVVGKEMYTFPDRKDRSLTLRPENTAGVVRACIQHSLVAPGNLQRLWYCGPMFRYERAQEGRQRQFHQLGAEVLGSADPRADAEVIALATDLLQRLGLSNLTMALNSVGDGRDRQAYRHALVEFLTPYHNDLDPDSQDRLSRNPLRILDSKDLRTQAIVADAPSILDHLSPDSKSFFDRVQQSLTDLGIAFTLNSRLVRGLDYYTHTAFEIQSSDLGAQATVCGGGRYDGLVEQLGGPSTPAVGWAMGLERLMILLQRLQEPPAMALDFYLVSRGAAAEAQALQLAQQLRRQDFAVELDLSGSAFGKQFKRAARSGAAACLVLGDAEAEAQTVQLKWLTSGEQFSLSQVELLEDVEGLRSRLALAAAALATSA
ncbi:MAG: histidine--tRNA ligase [Synechococcales cyanobacterium RU_4_20]|nr:histidine--tRNA ligase [Synechococcales cyanobacterium RU_4_20]